MCSMLHSLQGDKQLDGENPHCVLLSAPHWLLLNDCKGTIKEHFVSFRRREINVKTHSSVRRKVAPAVKCIHTQDTHSLCDRVSHHMIYDG